MATYHQYSEIVAAYGTRLPPPSSQPEKARLGLPLLYAALGVALGTLTGMTAALISLQPTASNHLALINSHPSAFKIRAITYTGQPPVIQNHSDAQAVDAMPSPAIQNHVDSQAAAAQPPVLETKKVLEFHPPAQAKLAKPAAAARLTAPTLQQDAAAEPVQAELPVVQHHALDGELAPLPASTAATAAIDPMSEPAVAAPVPPAVNTVSLDSGFKPQVFYSEGDATVASYDAAGDTIQTDDGRTFVVGATVSVSTAASWEDYRANVHYRCDQGGKCTLTRAGVIALNARLI